MTKIRKMLHSLKHRLGFPWSGEIVTWTSEDGVLMAGYKCPDCENVYGSTHVPEITFTERYTGETP